MAKKDPMALVLDTGISSASSLTSGIRQNFGMKDRLPGEAQVASSARSLSSAIEEISPVTQVMNAVEGGNVELPPIPGQNEQIQMFGDFPENFPSPPGLDKVPQFVEDLIPDFLKPENAGYTSKNVNNNTAAQKKNTTRTTRRKDLFKLDPY